MINKNLIFFSLLFILFGQSSCNNPDENESISVNESTFVSNLNVPYLVVLGKAKDGGYPQAGCQKQCCKRVWDYPPYKRLVSCLAVVDPVLNKESEQYKKTLEAGFNITEELKVVTL